MGGDLELADLRGTLRERTSLNNIIGNSAPMQRVFSLIERVSTTDVPVYYSFVVLTTLGFGDITPVDAFAQRITALEAIVGQIFLATVVARFVALHGKRKPDIRSGEGANEG